MTEEQLNAIITRDRDVSGYWFREGYFNAEEKVIAQAMQDRRVLLEEVKRLNATKKNGCFDTAENVAYAHELRNRG